MLIVIVVVWCAVLAVVIKCLGINKTGVYAPPTLNINFHWDKRVEWWIKHSNNNQQTHKYSNKNTKCCCYLHQSCYSVLYTEMCATILGICKITELPAVNATGHTYHAARGSKAKYIF